MATKTERLTQNVAGAYYVDSSCIDCDMCRSTAPEVFRRDEEIGMSSVYHQPVTPAEMALAEEALAGCPTESIGNDGVGQARCQAGVRDGRTDEDPSLRLRRRRGSAAKARGKAEALRLIN